MYEWLIKDAIFMQFAAEYFCCNIIDCTIAYIYSTNSWNLLCDMDNKE